MLEMSFTLAVFYFEKVTHCLHLSVHPSVRLSSLSDKLFGKRLLQAGRHIMSHKSWMKTVPTENCDVLMTFAGQTRLMEKLMKSFRTDIQHVLLDSSSLVLIFQPFRYIILTVCDQYYFVNNSVVA